MKKLLFAIAVLGSASAASAADIAPRYAPAPPMIAAAYSWTGFYIGANVGGGWATTDWKDPNDCILCSGVPRYLGRSNLSGWLAGGQIGADYQVGSIVLGVELDGSWADISGSHLDITTPTDRLSSKIDSLGSITGRLGYAIDRALFYVKGGGAWAHDKHSVTDGAGVTFAASNDNTRWGWTIGGGLEYALGNNWSVKGEYQYMDFGHETGTRFSCPACTLGNFNFAIDEKISIAKAGLNYRFGG